MRLELGSPVDCTDGSFGKLADLVVDPVQRLVTHLVVEPPHRHGQARLVPAELASAGEDRITVRSTVEEVRRMPEVEDYAYVRSGELPLEDPDWDVGIQTVLVHPYYDAVGYGGPPPDYDPNLAIVYDRIPKGEVEIRRSSDVLSADDHRLGRVDGFLVDGEDAITHLVLERGHLFGRREVTIPIESVGSVATDAITLALTKDEVGRLPAVPVRR
jgi:sporulation protein YlmC with PRC-barrel domain